MTSLERLLAVAMIATTATLVGIVLVLLTRQPSLREACDQLNDVRAIVEAQPNAPPLPPVPSGCLR